MPGDIGGRSNRNSLSTSGGSGGTTINPTNNVIPKRLNATTFADSALTDDGTAINSTEPFRTTTASVSYADAAGTTGVRPVAGAVNITLSTNITFVFGNGFSLGGGSGQAFQLANTTNPNAGSPDVSLSRLAANVWGIGTVLGTSNGWFQWGGQSRTTAQFDAVATTALANVTGLSVTLIAGRKYKFRASLWVTADVVGGSKYAIGGTATATSIVYNINAINNGTSVFAITSKQTALGGSAGQVGATDVFVEIIGTIVCNAAGTLTVQFAQNVANGTSSVLINSTFEVFDTP
jgi:hypothetical protein